MSPDEVTRQARAAAALRESLQATCGPDDDLLVDMVEGETSLFEAIDRLLLRMADDRIMIAGIDTISEDLALRRYRFARRIEDSRALIEQAMMIAEFEKPIERPMATLSLAKRAPRLEISAEADVPAEFWKPGAPSLDKKAVAEALKAGQTVPGAYLTNAAPSLTVRTK